MNPAESWSNGGQVVVKWGSNGGQMVVKWRSSGVETAVKNRLGAQGRTCPRSNARHSLAPNRNGRITQTPFEILPLKV
jgi:hypothetical protein